ncbi:MAG TPA: hypothetical protein ENJ09_00855 [Planctomycetes bacterium]|nr:hypothetical protein [Planctomycetota bacterium]
MTRPLHALSLLLALALPAAAQTPATATVRTGCTVPAPPGSLVAAPVQPTVWIPDAKGKINMEIESLPPFGGWRFENSLPGYRGTGYFQWVGANHFNNPGVDILSFRFDIQTAGNHIIRLHNRHDNPDPTASNDCWVRLDGGPWEKWVDSWGPGGVGIWSFNAFLESTGSFLISNLSQGIHTVEIAGRSNGFKIDSLHVLPTSVWFANSTDPSAEPLRERPIIGGSFTGLIDDPSNAAQLPAGRTQAFWFASLAPAPGFPCGTVLPAGEALISLQGRVFRTPGRTWQGPGNPVAFTATFPNDPSLVGLQMATQGLFAAAGRLVLTDGLDLLIGDV